MSSTSRYELMVLAAPEITQEESAEIEKRISEIVKKRQGSMVSFDRWGKYRLAYPVARNDYGVYFLARFEVAGDATLNHDFRSMFKIKFDHAVMRNMLTALDLNAPTEYKRPRSLEETPEKETESLLKGQKVKDLLSAVKSSEKADKKTEPAVKTESKEVALEAAKTAKEVTKEPTVKAESKEVIAEAKEDSDIARSAHAIRSSSQEKSEVGTAEEKKEEEPSEVAE